MRLAESLTALGGQDVSRPPNVAHLVAGLAGEPEGIAGMCLRQQSGEVAARIASHPSVGARALPTLTTAFIAAPVTDRPIWTVELLAAASRVGGEDLGHLLDQCSLEISTITQDVVAAGTAMIEQWLDGPAEVDESTLSPETFGLGSLRAVGYSADADRAVAITRARAGDSRVLLTWLQPDEETAGVLSRARPVPLEAVLDLRRKRGGPTSVADLVTAITHLMVQASLDAP